MSANTATSVGKTFDVFNGFLTIASEALDWVLSVLLCTGGIALGGLSWYLVITQQEQTNDHWGPAIAILVVMSFIGGFASISPTRRKDPIKRWADINLLFGIIMIVLTIVLLLMAGPYIKVTDTEVSYTPQGVLYFPGSKVPRGFISSKSHAVDLNYETTFTINSDEKTTTGVPLNLVRTVVVHEELLPITAAAERVKWLIGHSSGKDVKSQITQDAQDGFDAARQIIGKMEDASQIRVGMSFPSSHPWLSPVTVKEVTSSAQVVDSDKK